MKILLITPHPPFPPVSGNPIRNYNLFKRIAKEHEVWLLTFKSSQISADDLSELNKFCKEVVQADLPHASPLSRPFELFSYILSGTPPDLRFFMSTEMEQAIQDLMTRVDFDIVQIEDSYMGLYRNAIPKNARAKVFVTYHDIGYDKYARIARLERKLTRKLRLWFHSQMLRHWEPSFAKRIDCNVLVSERDQQRLLSMNPHLHTQVIPNGIDTREFAAFAEESTDNALVYVGNMGYLPNVDAVTHFCQEMLPLIRRQIPDAELWIVGINPRQEVLDLQSNFIHVTGPVEDVRAYYQKSKVCVVPLRAGGGTRLKILESMSLNRPVVSTSIGCEGLNLENGTHLLIADKPDDFASEVIRLLQNKTLREKISANALNLVRRVYDWDLIAAQLTDSYQSLLNHSNTH